MSSVAVAGSTSIPLANLSSTVNTQPAANPSNVAGAIPVNQHASNPSNPPRPATLGPTQGPTFAQRVKKRICSFDRGTVVVGIVLATIAVIPAYKSWNLSEWTALKDYLEYCRDNLDSLTPAKRQSCEGALRKGLGLPPYILIPGNKRAVTVEGLHKRISIALHTMHLPHIRSPVPPTDTTRPLNSVISSLTSSSKLGVILLWTFCVVGYVTLVSTALTLLVLVRQTSYLTRKRPQTTAPLKIYFWMITNYLALLSSVLLPIGIYLYYGHTLQTKMTTALKEYIEYCSNVQPAEKDYIQCQAAINDKAPQTEGKYNVKAFLIDIPAVVGLGSCALTIVFGLIKSYSVLRTLYMMNFERLRPRYSAISAEEVDYEVGGSQLRAVPARPPSPDDFDFETPASHP